MFGTKLRTWMETHIVRSRKKQHRNKDDKKPGNCSKIISSSPSCHIESNSFERQYGKKSPKHNEDKDVLEIQSTDIIIPSKTSMSLQQNNVVHCTVNNLSSPESAYSTGYSTDGTSPGASIPPEYYINIRTGTHYFHSNPANISATGVTPNNSKGINTPQVVVSEIPCKVGSLNQTPSTVTITVLSPRPSRHKDGTKKKIRQNGEQLPESSTEEDVADRMVKVNHSSPHQMSTPKAKSKLIHPMCSSLHRRTESYDEGQQRAHENQSVERDSGDSLTAVPAAYQCTSPYLSGASPQCTSPYLPGASPRQRNRIRTNPWLATAPGIQGSKSYNSQGETSSTVGSSSTLSSSGCKQTSDDNSQVCLSPRSKEKRRLVKEHLKKVKNHNTVQNSSLVFSPVLNVKKHINAVTTCSPQPNRSCHHILRPRSPVSSSSSSSPSSASDDEHHGNTSDFSDDDVTLNEMLGKFDESYVYEKETDILSDSDPTDCEDQADYEDKTDNSNLPESEQHEDFDFIDHGSLVELAHSDSDCSNKAQLTGHCTYHHLPGQTPEASRKLTPRLRESISRRQSANRSPRDRQSRRSSRNKGNDGRKKLDSPSLSSQRRSNTYRKSNSQILDSKNSCEAIPNIGSPVLLHNRRSRRGDSVPRPGETPGKHINLNRVLMERLMNNQRNGTRSADGTPVSLRRRGGPSNYNGKYIKNQYVSNLISSDANFNERRSSLEEKHGQLELPSGKPRSNSFSIHSNENPNNGLRPPSSVGVTLNDLDKEGDLKYRQLIQEAEHIIEDLQVKTRTEYLSPTFRCKGGMERAKPSSPMVFSVPPSPLSLRYDVYRESNENPQRQREISNNNSIFEQPIYSVQKEKGNDNEDSLFKTISKTLERIIIRSTSDTNRKLDKSVSDPFAKGKKKFVLPATATMYSNRGIAGSCDQQSGPCTGFATPNLFRRSSTGNTPLKLSTFGSASKVNENEIANQSSFRKFFRRPEKYKTTSFDEHLDRHNLPENGFCLNSGFNKPSNEGIYENAEIYQQAISSKQDVHNARYLEMKSPLMDYSPNGNTPSYINGFQQIPWQHRTSQAERLKHLSDLRNSPKRKTDSPDLPFEQKPTLVSFRSFDLGNKYAVGSGYCPQSEPVKRKIYTCSATFEKLQKSLLRKQPEIQTSKDSSKKTDSHERNCNKLKERVTQLRRERLQAEAKVLEFETQGQIDRLALAAGNHGTG